MISWRIKTISLLAVFYISVAGQSTSHVITGIVKDASGSLVPKASVALLSGTGKHVESTFSGLDGSFRLRASTLTDGQLQIQCKGFKPFVLHLDLSHSPKPILACYRSPMCTNGWM